jgi:hypothetical protein
MRIQRSRSCACGRRRRAAGGETERGGERRRAAALTRISTGGYQIAAGFALRRRARACEPTGGLHGRRRSRTTAPGEARRRRTTGDGEDDSAAHEHPIQMHRGVPHQAAKLRDGSNRPGRRRDGEGSGRRRTGAWNGAARLGFGARRRRRLRVAGRRGTGRRRAINRVSAGHRRAGPRLRHGRRAGLGRAPESEAAAARGRGR